jgi:catechol 2,3-dioxygenase
LFLSAGGYHHIGLNTWYSKNNSPADQKAPGLFHKANLHPERRDLTNILKRLIANHYSLNSAAYHNVSDTSYLNDPDENGVEL